MRNRRGFAVALLSPITVIYLLVMVAPVSFFLSISVFRYSAFNLWDVAFTGQNFAVSRIPITETSLSVPSG